MLDPIQAKQKFRTTLTILLVSVFWPFIATLLGTLLSLAGVKNMGVGVLLLLVIWLGLFIWLFVQCWRLAPEVGVTPWATLWLFVPFVGIFIIGMLFLEPLKYMADGKPENKKLPRTWDLIKQTWKLYVETFKESVKVSIYFLYASIISGVIIALSVYLGASYELMALIMAIPLALANLWISILVFHRLAALESGQTIYQPLKASWRKWLSYIWLLIEILVFSAGPMLIAFGIVLLASVLAGNWQSIAGWFVPGMVNEMTGNIGTLSFVVIAIVGTLLLIPAWIWLIYKSAVWNSFALPILILEEKKGVNDLKEATKLGKNRWWGLFWKNQLAGITFGGFGMLIGLGISIALIILSSVFKFLNLGETITALLSQIADGLISMILVPLFMGFSVKLYKAFKRSVG